MSKKSITIAVVVIVVLGAIVYYASKNKSATPAPAPVTGTGEVVIGISDAAMDIKNVSSIIVTVSKVEVQNASEGWVTISGGSKQYDLIQLKQSGAVALFGSANIPAGTYNKVRLTISNVQVTTSGKIQEAKLPSGTLSILGRLVVENGKTSTAVFDFKADKSLHMTGDGKLILAPVVNLQTKSDASVEKQSDNTVKIGGGKMEDEVNIGMDVSGEVKNNFELDTNAKIEIDSSNMIRIVGQPDADKKKDDDHKDDNKGSVTLNLSAQNNSGIAGTVTLENSDGKTKVTLKLAGVSTGVTGLLGISLGASHPAHIHTGSCANIGAVKYPLTSTVDGKSETTVNASIADLKAQLPLAINVHKSADEMGVYVACTDIKL